MHKINRQNVVENSHRLAFHKMKAGVAMGGTRIFELGGSEGARRRA